MAEMIEPRVEEILVLARREVKRAGGSEFLGAGVVLTGGTAAMPGVIELAEEIFEMPARRGNPVRLPTSSVALDHPMFATVVGLVHYAAGQEAENHRPVEKIIDKLGAKLKNLVAQFL